MTSFCLNGVNACTIFEFQSCAIKCSISDDFEKFYVFENDFVVLWMI